MTDNKLKALVGKRLHKKTKFMDTEVVIYKLSVAQVMDIQKVSKEAETAEDKEESGFNILKHVIRLGMEDAADLSNEDFEAFPLEELSRVATEIMAFSGIGDKGK